MRYISHEIRTPLNIVYMGLQFVKKTQEDQIIANSISNFDSISTPTIPSASASVPNSELTQCVDDMYNACASAINILNDLLLIDKVEDGKLSLEKSKIRIGELFRTSLSPFNAQVGILVTASSAHLYMTYSAFSFDRQKRNKFNSCMMIPPICLRNWKMF